MASSVRAKAREILNIVPKYGQEVASTGDTAALFTKITGFTHKTLQDNWDGGGILTSCNSFVGYLSTNLGAKEFLGQFEIDKALEKVGKGVAWVPSGPGRKPGYGDVFRSKAYHMGISLDFEGGQWNTVEGGQGGPKSKKDIVKRKRQDWDHAKLRGWVDIEVYFDLPAQKPTPPDWLQGWWTVKSRTGTSSLYFGKDRKAMKAADDTGMPFAPLKPTDTGPLSLGNGETVYVRWSSDASLDCWTVKKRLVGGSEIVTLERDAGGETIVATRPYDG